MKGRKRRRECEGKKKWKDKVKPNGNDTGEMENKGNNIEIILIKREHEERK